MMRKRVRLEALMFGACLALASACDEGDDGDGNADDPAETSGDGDGDGDATGDGDGDRSPTTGDVGGDGDGDGDGPSTGGDFGGTDGELDGCAAWLDAGDCVTAPGCAPVYGQPLVDQGGSWCEAADDEFIGCVDSLDLCPNLPKTLCDGDGYWRTSACVPANLDVCDPPGDIVGAC